HPLSALDVSLIFYCVNRTRYFQEAYRSVERWSGGQDIFTKKFVFIPIAMTMHWSLTCLCN
ncbi:unnamed protein product, partial [Ectocarpus fasciculatus]